MDAFTHFFALLVRLVREGEALLKESDKLPTVLLDELGGEVLQHWAEKLAEVARGLGLENWSVDCLGHDLVVRIESGVHSQFLMGLSLHADGVKDN